MKSKRWKPKLNEQYYSIELSDNVLTTERYYWYNVTGDKFQYRIGNIFRTDKEAQAKLRQIKKILKERV